MGAITQCGSDKSWPLWEQPEHFDLGHILNSAITDVIEPPRVGALGPHHAGLFECHIGDETLIWSGGVYDIFGLERGAMITRSEALDFYTDDSRAALELLRPYAIRQRRGFTLDVRIRAAAVGEERAVQLIAAPVCEDGRVVRLHGLKLLLSARCAPRASSRPDPCCFDVRG